LDETVNLKNSNDENMSLSEQHPILALPVQLVLTIILVAYLLAFIGGWWSLSRQYRTERRLPNGSFVGSGSLRYIASYNNVLRLGSDGEGMYMTFWPRLAHPPLFVPWDQIEVGSPRRMIFKIQTLTIGKELRVPFTMRPKDVQRLLRMAGRSRTSE
jgi:hypothetical protein